MTPQAQLLEEIRVASEQTTAAKANLAKEKERKKTSKQAHKQAQRGVKKVQANLRHAEPCKRKAIQDDLEEAIACAKNAKTVAFHAKVWVSIKKQILSEAEKAEQGAKVKYRRFLSPERHPFAKKEKESRSGVQAGSHRRWERTNERHRGKQSRHRQREPFDQEQQHRERPHPNADQKQQHVPDQEIVDKWRADVDAAFADYLNMHTFPKPPGRCCDKPACKAKEGNRLLQVCECTIQNLFESVADLKLERLRWHPDKFSKCPEQHREAFQQMAKEVFSVVQTMYDNRKIVGPK